MTESSEDRFVRLAEEAQQEYERRIAAKRTETGCYAEDGLYKINVYEKANPFILYLSFVDGSALAITPDGEVHPYHVCEKYGVTSLFMAMQWFENGGKEWSVNKLRELSGHGMEAEPHAV